MYCIEVIVPKGWTLRPIISRACGVFGKKAIKNIFCTETCQYDIAREKECGSFWRVSFAVASSCEDKLRDYALEMKDLSVWDCRAYKLLDYMNVEDEF